MFGKRADATTQSIEGAGTATASGDGGVAIGGDSHAPITVTVTKQTIISAARAVSWPVRVGDIPELASAFQPRQDLRDHVIAARQRGDDVVLTQPETAARTTRILSGGGGVGKSQLAAWFAHRADEDSRRDLVVWVAADTPEQIIATYARAAGRVGAEVTGDATGDAKSFLEWLRETDRDWLVVLDDITNPAHLAGWWPPSRPVGWTLATTRLHDAALASSGRHRIGIGVYTPEESLAYLTIRLTEAGQPHLIDDRASILASALGHLPLALSHAAAFMDSQAESCTEYLARYTKGRDRLQDLMPADSDPDSYGRPVTVTLLLALDGADADAPAGLARAALALAAMLDPAGQPEALWGTSAVTDYLTRHRTVDIGKPVTASQVRKVLRLLHRYALITHTGTHPVQTVRVHALTARAMQETLTDLALAARVAADALLAIWPDDDHASTELTASLFANVTILQKSAAENLWQPDGHPVLYRAGLGLLKAGLHTAAADHWHLVAAQALRLLGPEHLNTLIARGNLASSYRQVGRVSDAIIIEEQVVTDTERVLGPEHLNTLIARGNLAGSYRQVGRVSDAIIIEEQVVTDTERVLGPEHLNTLIARGNLAGSYRQVGRISDAIIIEEQVVTDTERVLGPEHLNTLIARGNLADSYRQVGRISDAIIIEEQVVTDTERVLGPEHPNTLTARGNLASSYWHASSYWQAGRISDAVTIFEQVVTDTERLLGPEHPDTLTARGNLADSYRQVGRISDAITIEEQVVTGIERVLGPEHPNTLIVRGNLADSYWQAGRISDAFTIFEQVVTETERLLGPEYDLTRAVVDALSALAQNPPDA
ncbi:FxSxx-COOH system tetratricopeptide repeat protein [Actinoplanes couchii]|uniref:FxSxx-COOH system tetratricopeptide repeat protein n=3 Tax=Actinoplanes couchii TaxID=403638 RepID=UPI00286C66EC|nr:FxSxx-COOH system tetratricopeptide repeat protein [Actinoplanes couchii]